MVVMKDWMTPLKEDVLARDGKCRSCGAKEDLHIRCVRDWHRNHIDSWITLCDPCRTRSYEEARKTKIDAKNPQKRILFRRIEELMAEVKQLREELKWTKDLLARK
jgi:hypothetical protein